MFLFLPRYMDFDPFSLTQNTQAVNISLILSEWAVVRILLQRQTVRRCQLFQKNVSCHDGLRNIRLTYVSVKLISMQSFNQFVHISLYGGIYLHPPVRG